MKTTEVPRSRTLFERLERKRPSKQTSAGSPEEVANAIYEEIQRQSDGGDLYTLFYEAVQVLNRTIGTDAALRQALRRWLKEPGATIPFAEKSGKQAMTEPRPALKLWSNGKREKLCLVPSGRRWKYVFAQEKEFFWKSKHTRWYRRIDLGGGDRWSRSEYRQVLSYLGTPKGLCELVLSARFWAYYD